MDYENIDNKQAALMRCDSIQTSAERMTSGNYMHGRNNILYQVQRLREHINGLTDLKDMFSKNPPKLVESPSLWITVARQLPERITASNGALMDMSEQVIVKDVWGKKWIAQYDYRYKRWWGEEQVVVDVVSWMKIPD